MRFLLVLLLVGAGFCFAATADTPTFPQSAESDSGLQSKPEGVTAAWPYAKHFYAYIAESKGTEDDAFFHLIPDRYKLDFVSPLLFICGCIGILVSSVWFLVKQFQVHWGWGVGQIAANVASCVLVIPGFILALVFLVMHWHKAFNIFVLGAVFWAMLILGVLMVPSWAPQAAAIQMMKP